MRRLIVGTAAVLLVAGGLLISLAPDTLSMMILAVMCAMIGIGFFLSLMPGLMFISGFHTGRQNLEQTLDVQSTETWIAVFRLESLFREKELDALFAEYKNKVEQQKEADEIISDIDEYISEDLLSLRTWQGVVLQIPGALTGLGILGTFVGLISGISRIGFSSVEAALESISNLIDGINTAFYTSIAGVILSIVFNILNRMIWNSLLREHGMFVGTFHRIVIPSAEEQVRARNARDMRVILQRLDRIPKQGGFSLSAGGSVGEIGSNTSEQNLMQQIMEGLKRGEFVFYLQPRLDLNMKKWVAADALVRWNHERMGVLTPASFVPVLEKNGFITRLDAYIWEQVCATIRRWIDRGERPVPISLNLSKTDLLAMDVADFFGEMLEKYRIPPRALELEIAKNAYIQSPGTTAEVASALRRMGFRVILDGFDGDYIALNMMEGIEADAIKLDLRFLQDHSYNALLPIFEKARKLNFEMLAEGIENTEEIASLKKAGCSVGQGYYFQKPMSIEAFEAANP